MAAEQMKDQAAAAAGTAAEQSREVAATASQQVGEVAGQAVEQAAAVVGEARDQARALVSQAATEAKTQANAQTDRLAEGLRGIAGQLQALVEGRPQEAGALPDYARQATGQLQRFAGRIADGGVEGVVDDVQRFARRRPGIFLAGAAVAGFLGGRLLRGAQAASQQGLTSGGGGGASVAQPSPALPVPGQVVGATTEETDVIVLSESASPVPADGTTGIVSTTIGGTR